MTTVAYREATCFYPGAETPAVDGLSLEISDGELLVLVGPSGSGKSTALRMLAGLESLDSGEIRIGDHDVSEVRPRDRDIAMVFQNYALYPQLSVAQNMGFALKQRGVDKEERAERVREAARVLDLEPYLERKPKHLSGGQRQRVAMGRAIVRQPAVYLMDEPLSNLDAKLRVQTRTELVELQKRLGVTTVYVTHDQVEAMTMGHRVAVLKDGVLQQCDTPQTLFHKPLNLFVAGFIGSPAMNLIEVGDGLKLGGATFELPNGTDPGEIETIGFRPEALTLGEGPMKARVRTVEDLGSEIFIHLAVDNAGSNVQLTARMLPPFSAAIDDEVSAHLTGEVHLFDASGMRVASGPASLREKRLSPS